MGMTVSEKIFARKAGLGSVVPGQIVTVEPDAVMSHDNAALVITQFRRFSLPKVWNPDKIVIPLDHRVPAESAQTANAHAMIRAFTKDQGIKNFYDIKEGICHQVFVEKGHAKPGELVVGTDSHTTMYGAVGCFSTGIGATEMAAVWATGKIWLRVPETLKVVVNGTLPRGVYAKDVILLLLKMLTVEGANYKTIEFSGTTVDAMTISERCTWSNVSMEMGAKAGLIPFDGTSESWFRTNGFAWDAAKVARPDPDASYEREIVIDVSDLEPQIACPHSTDNVTGISAVVGTKIHEAFLGSCTNARVDDLAIAAGILAGKKVDRDTRLIVIPASRAVLLEAMRLGYIQTFVEAGAQIQNPGCGPCLGAHQGILGDGERCISSSNRNFKGRMGNNKSEVFLASPAAVAAAALTGVISDPRDFVK